MIDIAPLNSRTHEVTPGWMDHRTHKLAEKIWHYHQMKIRVKTPARMETRRFTMRKTHHGPNHRRRDGKLSAIRMANFEGDGWLRE